MSVIIYKSARRHGITGAEIREVLSHPVVRYRLRPRMEPDAQVWRLVGDARGGPFIDVVAELVDGEQWHVFHAMLLTAGVAGEVLQVTAGQIDLTRHTHRRQRPEEDRR